MMRKLLSFSVLMSLGISGCGGGAGGSGGGGGGENAAPILSITKTHQGNFTQGQQNATYTVTLSNSGGTLFGGSSVSEALPPGLTLVAMAGNGWTCSNPQPSLPLCQRNDQLASGASYPSITVTVNVATNATSPQINKVQASGPGSPTASDPTTIQPASPAPAVVGSALPSPIFAGDPQLAIPVTVTNDAPGDVLTATLTVDAFTNAACTAATCGTLGTITGGSGTYSLPYTPPAAAGFTTPTQPTLVISSNIPGSFTDTDGTQVFPAGTHLVTLSGLPGYIQAGTPPVTSVTATVYNDTAAPPNNGVILAPLTGSGIACSNSGLGNNFCGTLSTPIAPVVSGTTTTTTFTYTPPPAVAAPASSPESPYDRPRVQVNSVADNTQYAVQPFLLSNNPKPVNTGVVIFRANKFNSVLAMPSAAPLFILAIIGNDTGNKRTVTWTLTDTTGASCSPTCGTLTGQLETGDGATVFTQINYTPPSSVPTVAAQLTPTITSTSNDASSQTDSFTFTITDGSCGTGQEALLNGQYAFLIHGGGANAGYGTATGSFNANGTGGITGGVWDSNDSTGPYTGPSGNMIASAGSSYTVGADHRACIVLTDTLGNVLNFRGAVGTLAGTPSVATQGQLILFNDNNGLRLNASGMLMKQDATSFSNSQLNGPFAFGAEGVDSTGGRISIAGVITANGAGTFSLIMDVDDAGSVSGPITGGSGTYNILPPGTNGRGTGTLTFTYNGKLNNGQFLLYMVSSSHALFMLSSSAVGGNPIFSGELKKQTGPFNPTTLDGGNFVVYDSGIASGSGGNDTAIGQLAFTTNGNATLNLDENNNGTETAQPPQAITVTIAPTGRATITAASGKSPILYLIDSTSGFLVSTGGEAGLGYLEKQAAGPFSDATLNGLYFFGSFAAQDGSGYAVGTGTLDGAGNINATQNNAGLNGFKTVTTSTTNGTGYSFASGTVLGKGTVGDGNIGYIISSSKVVFMITSTSAKPNASPSIAIVQK